MTTVELRLIACESPVRPAAAWFIPGRNVEMWLREMNVWQAPLAEARVYILPSSASQRGAFGVLVILPEDLRPSRVFRAQPFGVVLSKLYLPVAAKIAPAYADEELCDGLPYDVNVFCPSLGLVGFAENEARSVASLLISPPKRETQWDRARVGAMLYGRLVSVDPDVLPTLKMLMSLAQDDIGTKPIQNLPKRPDESNEVLVRAMKAGASGAFKLLVAPIAIVGAVLATLLSPLFKPNPGRPPAQSAESGNGDGSGGMLDSLRQWSRSLMAWLDSKLEESRNKELHRLLAMMDSDPDAGLRHAIPLAGSGSRGLASTPGDTLTRRETDFNLNNIYGSGAADPWDIPDQLRTKLTEKYSAAAKRELQLKRYRRAAYIFSELLGNHHAAANALEQGKFFREAAVIYSEVLKNRPQAAKCLAQGGLLREAIAIYEDLKDWIAAGELYEQLDRHEEARNAYDLAVKEKLATGNLVEAAKLQRELLKDTEGALAILEEGWPKHSQAVQCIQKQFEILGELGRHAISAKKVAHVLNTPSAQTSLALTTGVLADIHERYPDNAVRHAAADAARNLIGQNLRTQPLESSRQLVRTVTRLAKRDKLLTRDVTRYLAHRTKIEPRPAPTRNARSISELKKVSVQKAFTPFNFEAHTLACVTRDIFLVAGYHTTRGLTLYRSNWNSGLQLLDYPPPKLPVYRNSLKLAVPTNDRLPVILDVFQSPGSTALRFSENAQFSNNNVHVETPAWLPTHEKRWAVCYDERDQLHVFTLQEHNFAVLSFSPDGSMSGAVALECDNPELGSQQIPMLAQGQRIFLSLNNNVLIVLEGSQSRREMFEAKIVRMAVTRPFTRLRLAIANSNGGFVLWPAEVSETTLKIKFGDGMAEPHIAFTGGGDLVAVSNDEIRVYLTDNKDLVLCASEKRDGSAVAGIIPGQGINQFAILEKTGKLVLYTIA